MVEADGLTQTFKTILGVRAQTVNPGGDFESDRSARRAGGHIEYALGATAHIER